MVLSHNDCHLNYWKRYYCWYVQCSLFLIKATIKLTGKDSKGPQRNETNYKKNVLIKFHISI